MIEKIISIYCDGGSRGNPGPAASAFIIKNPNNEIIYQNGKYLGITTNNEAEYQAVVLALEYLSKNPMSVELKVNFYLDSILVVSQINGTFKINKSNLRSLLFKIRELESEIKSEIVYSQIPREKNWEADLIVNQTLDTNL